MILITSSAYVIPEFQAELGKIPPCMLPLGNLKLLEFQVNEIRERFKAEEIYLTLPDSYELSQDEALLIKNLNIKAQKIPDSFSLCQSILYFSHFCNYNMEEPIRIIYGDTLIKNIPEYLPLDFIGVSKSNTPYDWKYLNDDIKNNIIWCGFYSFSNFKELLKSLALNTHDITDAILNYFSDSSEINYINFDNWYDLGHINTYFQTRSTITTQRAFNHLHIENGILTKTGTPSIKIQAEAFWFKNIPNKNKIYTARLIEDGYNNKGYYYALEYLPNLPLNELFVNGRIGLNEWKSIFSHIQEFLNFNKKKLSSLEKENINNDINSLYNKKMMDRLFQFKNENSFNIFKENYYNGELLPSLYDITQECISYLHITDIEHSIMHGDFCFSNILIDTRADRIKVIDPRGLTYDEKFSIYGDQNYDLAKLTHSVIGLYDYIIANRVSIKNPNTQNVSLHFDLDERTLNIQKLFNNMFLNSNNSKIINSLVILLFISMLPLHKEKRERQNLLLLNAFRLYQEFNF